MKYFRMSYDEVVFKRSYLNLILLNRAIPGYKPFDEDKKGREGNNTKSSRNGNTTKKNGENTHANDFFMNFM